MSCNESTLMLKCGLLVGDQPIGDFKFISWFYGQQKPCIRQQTKGIIAQSLRQRLKTIFPDIVDESFQVVFVDDSDDKIILPIDDIKETVTALRCFGFLSGLTPIQIFVQIPDSKDLIKDGNKLEERTVKIRCCEDSAQIIANKLSKLESTFHNLGQRIVVLLEDIALNSKQLAKDAKSDEIPTFRQATSDAINSTDSNVNTQSSEITDSPTVRSRTSSSSSFSVQSHSDHSGEREEGWTRVNGEINGIGRRRLRAESSCASHRSDYLQDGASYVLAFDSDGSLGSPGIMNRSP